ncbi:YhdP family protein [Psychromonas aquimarina]|uniref:YhdP family protein n=1 Tax=Psychromonas aquimarina TaxID=444919 RepID=UPI000411036A|nr:YhdP family protein [Psychromonas aquimarina]
MKHFTFRWLKRIYALVAFKLFLIALCLTLLRIFLISIDDYKEDAALWLAEEYNINLSVEDISAGIDFDGMVLTLNNIELLDSADLPFVLKLDHLFLHLNFWESITESSLVFNRISLQGAQLTVKPGSESTAKSEQSLLTLDSLKKIFLQQLNKFSIKDSVVKFKDHLGNDKTIVIETLRWLNKGGLHQGVGAASLPNSLGDNSLQFVVDLQPDRSSADREFSGQLYVDADNLNITDYLIDRVNADARIAKAVLGFEAWADFSLGKSSHFNKIQVALQNSQLSWSQSRHFNDWQLNGGLLQLTNNGQTWLLDSYDLDIERNQKKWQGLNINGYGTRESAYLDFSSLHLADLLPFYLLGSDLSTEQITYLSAFDMDAQIEDLSLVKNKDNTLNYQTSLKAFKNRPQGGIPGLSNAHLELSGGLSQGELSVKLPKQKIYFDGQFSRPMPVKSGLLDLRWLQSDTGFKLYSEQSLLKTEDLDTTTQFSLFFPNKKAQNQSPFLSLYSYASLNDAGKAQHYYPIKAMGDDVFDYLQPTLKKGQVKGAKILWYGAFSNYPYEQHNGIFQAWVPVRKAQYDFYGQWQGLTDLDLDLLFENDWLTMHARRAQLGQITVQKLDGKIDHLNPDGILTITADISDDAQEISDYLKNSPLKDSVGNALNIIEVQNELSGKLQLSIPFNRETMSEQTVGEITLTDNDINLHLTDELTMPLKEVNGKFSFINGDLTAQGLNAQLFEQPVDFSFSSKEKDETYQVNADIAGIWQLAPLSGYHTVLQPARLSGSLDWNGSVDFEYNFSGGYEFDVAFNSAAQGMISGLPAPFNKNALQSWPTDVQISGDDYNAKIKAKIKDKLVLAGAMDFHGDSPTIPYSAVNIGGDDLSVVETNQHIVKVNLDKLNLTPWYEKWLELNEQGSFEADKESAAVFSLDEIKVDIRHAQFFEQPLAGLKITALNDKDKWSADIYSDNLQTTAEYRFGVPVRVDLDIKKINFQELDLSKFNADKESVAMKKQYQSTNLMNDYPEVFAECVECIVGDINLSPLSMHIFPSKKRLNIDYIKIGSDNEFTSISGIWDQRRTNVIIDSIADQNNNPIKRLGYVNPVVYQKAELNGAFNWIGAPWEFNFDSLNGAFAAEFKDGSITEVSDKGARLLSIFSLDGIRRSLNLEFDNVFSKGFNFDDFTLSGNITDGIVENDDFNLNGSAGRITGEGLIDLPNFDTNYKISYSPAVTSSLPVLTAFAINPLTGAAVLMLSKLFEPVVETVIRVDFSVKGPIDNPKVELLSSQKAKVKLQDSEVLEEMNKYQPQNGPLVP